MVELQCSQPLHVQPGLFLLQPGCCLGLVFSSALPETHSMVAVDLDTGLCLLLGGLGNVDGDGRLGQDNVGDNGMANNVELLHQRVAIQQVATCQDKQNTVIGTSSLKATTGCYPAAMLRYTSL